MLFSSSPVRLVILFIEQLREVGYVDSLEKLDSVVSSIVEQVGEPDEHYSGDWVDIEKQEDVGDQVTH